MSGLSTSIRTRSGRHCVCRTTQAAPARSPLAVRVAEQCAALGIDVRVSLREVSGTLLRDLATMDGAGLCRVCGWPRVSLRGSGAPAVTDGHFDEFDPTRGRP